jgi:signal peptidase I
MNRTRVRYLLPAIGVCFLALWFVMARPAYLGGSVSYVWVSGVSMEPTLHNGDLVLVREQASYARGDVVAFRLPSGEAAAGGLVIHRIVGGSAGMGFRTQGDNKHGLDPWRPAEDDVVGALWLRIPAGGLVIGWIRDPVVFAGLAAGLAVFSVLAGEERGEKRKPAKAAPPLGRTPPSRMSDAWTLAELRVRHAGSPSPPTDGNPFCSGAVQAGQAHERSGG